MTKLNQEGLVGRLSAALSDSPSTLGAALAVLALLLFVVVIAPTLHKGKEKGIEGENI